MQNSDNPFEPATDVGPATDTQPSTTAERKGINQHGALFALPTGAGIVAITLVYISTFYRWDNFCPQTGYVGTHWLDPILYAIGDWRSTLIVGALWFVYAFVGVFVAQLPFALLIRRARRQVEN